MLRVLVFLETLSASVRAIALKTQSPQETARPGTQTVDQWITKDDLNAIDVASPYRQFLAAHMISELEMLSSKFNESCAVIGRSPNVLGHKNGRAIDEHDVVFRAGMCQPPQQFWSDVGSKLTYCASFWPDPGINLLLEYRPFSTGALVSTEPFIKLSPDVHLSMPKLSFFEELDSDLSNWIDATEVEQARSKSGLQKLRCIGKVDCEKIVDHSTGFYMVALARKMCSAVDVYGFDTSTSEDASYEHFDAPGQPVDDDGKTVVKQHGHSFTLERKVLKKWHDAGVIQLHPFA